MKNAKKLLSLVLAVLMLMSMAACGGTTEQPVNPSAKIKLNIVAADFGYGTAWLKAIAQVYMTNHPDVSIKVDGTAIPHQILSQIEGGLDTYDIVFGTSGTMGDYGEAGVLVNLNDLYASTVQGEDAVFADKLGNLAGYLKYNGNYYAVPYVASNTGIVVNIDTMQELYGDNYTLPNTTDEFLAMGKDIAKKGAYPYIDSTGYTNYLIENWWYQYDPVGYANYWNGLYIDENGETKQALNGESLEQPGKLIGLQLAETLANPKYGYNHQYATRMEFQEAQLVFMGAGYGDIDNKKVAFMPNGAWLENEMEPFMAEITANFAMFRVPVISSIISVLPDGSVADDAELSALITAIDAGSTALSGTGYEVTQNDFDRVRNARFSVTQNSTAHTAGITSTCKNVDAAKDFLNFLATDEASAVAARALNGVCLPYGYIPSEGNGYEISDFVASANALSINAIYIGHEENVLFMNGLNLTKLLNSLHSTLANGNKTAQQIYDEDIAAYKNDWKFLMGTTN